MAKVSFYLLEEAPSISSEPAHFELACLVAVRCFRQKQKCLVFCQNKQQAERFDELLWQLPVDAFVPHNLEGEGPVGGAPVEITWQTPQRYSRAVMINLAEQVPEFHSRFKHVIDFVPQADDLKLMARERYKHYRAAGNQLETLAASSIDEN
jgi:DNA polymerase III subunit chi